MTPRLTEISENETLQYLSYHGGDIPDTIRGDIARCSQVILDTARPRAVYKIPRTRRLFAHGMADSTTQRYSLPCDLWTVTA